MLHLSTTQNDAAWTQAVAELEQRAPTSRAAALQLAELRRNPSATFAVYRNGREVELSRPANWTANQKILADIRAATPAPKVTRHPVAQTSPTSPARLDFAALSRKAAEPERAMKAKNEREHSGPVRLCPASGMFTRHAADGRCRREAEGKGRCQCSGHPPKSAA